MWHGELVNGDSVRRVGGLCAQGLEAMRISLRKHFGEEIIFVQFDVGVGQKIESFFGGPDPKGGVWYINVHIGALFFPVGIELPDRPYRRTTQRTPSVEGKVVMTTSDDGQTWVPYRVQTSFTGIEINLLCGYDEPFGPPDETMRLFNSFRPGYHNAIS